MTTETMVKKLYNMLNNTKKINIVSLVTDSNSDYTILVELKDGSKFEIIVIPTRRFV